ncbi:MAG: Two-component system, NarL family, sensor histidine kinase BarA [Parcubacteria group bacterium]|nr:Two-component system, NarL family, sensor histidine kinase BarA [Parcubacteria group bacterium]
MISDVIQACEWARPSFLIFSSNVFDPLIYYSHITALVVSLGFGLFVLMKNRKSLAARILFLITLCLGTWLFSDLVVWATDRPEFTMFFWSLTILTEPLVYLFSLYFVYVFIDKKDISFKKKLLIFIPFLPIIVLTPTMLALSGFDLSSCDRDAVEGPLIYYGFFLEFVSAIWIILLAFGRHMKTPPGDQRKQIVLASTGIVLFLLSFAFGNIIGSLFSDLSFLGDYSWTIGQYGLFGVPVFIGMLAYIMVRFRLFNIKVFGAQILVVALVLLVGSLLLINDVGTAHNITYVTLVFVITAGYLLLRSVKREIEQRERIEKLAKELEQANKQQVTLIHFITHQIKGFVAKSRNIFSMVLDGDFGPVPDTMRPMLQEGLNSDTKGTQTIQEILNAANIKSGKVSYKMESFDLKALVDEIATEQKRVADEKGLALNVHTGDAPLMFTGDRGQLVNVFKNLIDNSVKYTPSGSVDVTLAQKDGKIHFDIKDTGVGITAEDMHHLFTEGGHGKESTKVNVESTGFGLYIVKNIIEAHKGKVWAESEGAGKGSTFVVELPV